jgi:hypothetical protein
MARIEEKHLNTHSFLKSNQNSTSSLKHCGSLNILTSYSKISKRINFNKEKIFNNKNLKFNQNKKEIFSNKFPLMSEKSSQNKNLTSFITIYSLLSSTKNTPKIQSENNYNYKYDENFNNHGKVEDNDSFGYDDNPEDDYDNIEEDENYSFNDTLEEVSKDLELFVNKNKNKDYYVKNNRTTKTTSFDYTSENVKINKIYSIKLKYFSTNFNRIKLVNM